MATNTFDRPLVVSSEEARLKLNKIITSGKVNQNVSRLSPCVKNSEREDLLLTQFASHLKK